MKAIAGAVILISSVCVVQADSLRSQIDSANRKVGQAMMKKDVAAMAKLFRSAVTPDFRYFENGRSMTVDQMIANIGSGLNMMHKVTIANAKLLTLRRGEQMAVATMKYTMGGLVDGPDKKPHMMLSSGYSTETFVRVGSLWKSKKMVWGNEKMTLDGKPMSPKQMMKSSG